MAATEIEEVEVFFDRLNSIGRITIEKEFDVGVTDRRTTLAKIILNPPLLSFAHCDDCLYATKSAIMDYLHQPMNSDISFATFPGLHIATTVPYRQHAIA